MITVDNILKELCRMAPLETALEFDNAGLLVGRGDQTVHKAIICLDCTGEIIDRAIKIGANLIITHHPIIFSPMAAFTAESTDNRAFRCAENGISVISMHTNLDSAAGGVNDCLAKALNLTKIKKIVMDDGFAFRKGVLPAAMTAEQLADYTAKKLGTAVRYNQTDKPVQTVAVCGGSGGDFVPDAIQNGCDALITADVKHHYFIDAAERNFLLIDAGHYQTEQTVIKPLYEKLCKAFRSVNFETAELPLFYCAN